ncbi:MAG: CvpA family protein [Planctomycetota bacterium]|nr:CvpA family protein [Planctomycetota bacterium]
MDSNTLVAAVDIYDAVMLAVLVMATVWGGYKGMAWQIASLAAIVVSGMVAIRFGATLAPIISDNEPWNRFIAMFVLYLLTSFTIWMMFRFVAGFIDRVKLKEFDRQMGALFGLAKGVLFCVIITFFAVTLSEDLRQTVLGSFSGRAIAILIKNATPVLPEEVTDVLGKYIEDLDRRLNPDEPTDGGILDRVKPGGDPLEGTDPDKIIDDIRSDVSDGIDKKFDDLEGRAGDKLDDAQKDLGQKASELREAIKDRFDLNNR